MEHVVQFGVSIDDEAIRGQVVRLATAQVVEELKRECRSELGLGRSSCYPSRFVGEVVDGVIAECKEQIVREAAAALAEKAPKQKWYREMMPGAVAEMGATAAGVES